MQSPTATWWRDSKKCATTSVSTELLRRALSPHCWTPHLSRASSHKSKPAAVEPDSQAQGSKDSKEAPEDDAGKKAKPADKPKAAPQVEADVDRS